MRYFTGNAFEVTLKSLAQFGDLGSGPRGSKMVLGNRNVNPAFLFDYIYVHTQVNFFNTVTQAKLSEDFANQFTFAFKARMPNIPFSETTRNYSNRGGGTLHFGLNPDGERFRSHFVRRTDTFSITYK